MYREISYSGWSSAKYLFSHTTTAGFITKEIISRYKQLCEDSKHNKIKDNSVIYLSPISSYPVYKLKNYIQENKLNIKKARKWDKIDTIIIDKDFLNVFEHVKNKTYTIVPAKEIFNEPKRYFRKEDWSYKRNDGYRDTRFFYIETDNITKHAQEFGHFSDFPKIEGISAQRNHGMKNICDNIDFICELFSNIEKYNIHVVLDSSLDTEINKDTVIDLEIYENLYNMLSSSDTGNWKLAKEIIANCEYNQSRPYILFLASVFNVLLTKSDNKNYHTVHKHLMRERAYFKWGYRTSGHSKIRCIISK